MEDLLVFYLKKSRCDLYLCFDQPLEEVELVPIRSALIRLTQYEPLEYILGKHPFYGLELTIEPSALVPRPETEILVDLIVRKIRSSPKKQASFWDVGTGSGAIGLGVKKALPQLLVTLSDICPRALELAGRNAAEHSLDVRLLQGDLFSPFSRGEKFDFLVFNPPYLSQEAYTKADPTLHREPKIALVGGPTGLEFYERFAGSVRAYLAPSAAIFLEIGFDQGEAVQKIFSDAFWKKKKVLFDWSGHTRFFFLETD